MANEKQEEDTCQILFKIEEIHRMETKYFYCYDQKLAKHLKASGLDYITLAKNRYDDKLFSLWAKTDEFEKAITEYNNK